MTPAQSWLLIAIAVGVPAVVAYACCVMAGRASRREEEILRRMHPRVRELDSGKLALAMRRAEVEKQAARAQRHRRVKMGGESKVPVEGPPDAAA